MAGLSLTSEPSASQQGSSQSLPPLVDELQLHSMDDHENEVTRDSPAGSEKHPSISGIPFVANDELQLVDDYNVDSKLIGQPTTDHHETNKSDLSVCNVRRLRNGKAVVTVISGNHKKEGPGDAEKQSSDHNLSSLLPENTHYMHEQHHTVPIKSSQDRQKQPPKKKASKRTQATKEGVVHPPRVTRSKTRLMTQNGSIATVVSPLSSDTPLDSRDQTMGDAETHQKTHTRKARVKYNKPSGCSATVKDANCSTSEDHLLTTNNRDKNSIPQQNGCLNGSHEKQHSSSLPSEESSSQPLSDVTNSTCDGIFADVIRPSFIHSSSQNRVYQLVAGKKNKKPRKQQPRKTAMHGKNHTIGEDHPSSDQLQDTATSQESTPNDGHDNCLRQCHNRKASQHMKTSGEDGVSH